MAKRRSAATETRSGARNGEGVTLSQEALPGMPAAPASPATQGAAPATKARKAPKSARPPTHEAVAPIVALRLAPVGGQREQSAAHPEPQGAAPERAAPSETRRTRKGGGVRKKFTELSDALADGWEIVQPIFARPLWSAADDSETAFSFVLRRERATRLVTVPGGRLVERFIASRRLTVDDRR